MAKLINDLRELLLQSLRLPQPPETIGSDTRLFGGELGLDSVDAVELVAAVERHYHVVISEGDLARFPLSSLSELARLLRAKGIEE